MFFNPEPCSRNARRYGKRCGVLGNALSVPCKLFPVNCTLNPVPHTAILLFTRNGKEEARHKGLSARLIERMTARAKAIAHKSGLPLLIIGSAEQEGNNFGERYADAFRKAFEKGYERVISIGNDCLSLPAEDLAAAAQALEKQAWVLGPARDGGLWLVGLRKEAFDYQSFISLPWESEHLLDATCTYLQREQTSCALLGFRCDLDQQAGLKQVSAELSARSLLKRWIISLMSALPPHCAELLTPALRPVFRQSLFSRPPPFPG